MTLLAVMGAMSEPQRHGGPGPGEHDFGRDVALLMAAYPGLDHEQIGRLDVEQYNSLIENLEEVTAMKRAI